MTNLGLIIIFLSWVAQYFHHLKKPQQLSPVLLLGYSLGVFLLVVDGMQSNFHISVLLNMASLIAVGMILSTIRKP